jgi:uracil permease
MGAIVAVIGLELAPIAAEMAGLVGGQGHGDAMIISLATLGLLVVFSVTLRGKLASLPILLACVGGYLVALAMGHVDLAPLREAPLVSFPRFTAPIFKVEAIVEMAPAYVVVLAEHVGHLVATSAVTGADLMADPGLHVSLFADGLTNILGGWTGATANTTYGENIGVLALTRVFSSFVIGVAAGFAVLLSFLGIFSALLNSIPASVLGGLSLMTFGVITVTGIRMMNEGGEGADHAKPRFRQRDLVLSSIILSLGVSGATINLHTVELKGMALSTAAAVVIGIFFRIVDALGLASDTSPEEPQPIEQELATI